MDQDFGRFLAAYPPSPGLTRCLDGAAVAREAESRFGMPIPDKLRSFWSTVGAGVFGGGELFFFGDAGSGIPDPDLLDWNAAEWWAHVYRPPTKGRPFFFAQTAFGGQLGFTTEGSIALPVLFLPDTVEEFRVASDLDHLFDDLLSSPGVLEDPERSARALAQLGPVPPGNNFVPDVSPFLGGKGESYHVESATVHLATAIAEWEAIRKLPPGSKVSSIEVDWR